MNKIIVILSLLFFTSCDLTPGLYKEILNAQEMVKEQNFKKAVFKYEEILNQKPSKLIKIKIYHQLGDIFSIYLNNQKKALHYFELIIAETDDPLWQVKVMEKIAEINFIYLKNYQKSIGIFKTLISFEPKLQNFDSYKFKLGLSIFNTDNFGGSIKIFNDILVNKKNKYYRDAFYQKGLAYFYLKKWNKAANVWKEYLKVEKRKERRIQTKFLIANAYETSEKLKEAYNIYYSLLGDYPNPKVIKNRLESLYSRRVSRKR
jgi:tetratricopeptide (TPR) repeat protein